MLKEIKANAGSVLTSIGGGAHGYICLILFQVTYATLITMIPFVSLLMLGVLQVAVGVTKYAIVHTKTHHDAVICIFYQYQLVQYRGQIPYKTKE